MILRALIVSCGGLAAALVVVFGLYKVEARDAELAYQAEKLVRSQLEHSEQQAANMAQRFQAEQENRRRLAEQVREINAQRLQDATKSRQDYEQLRGSISDSLDGNECRDMPIPNDAVNGLRAAANRANGIPGRLRRPVRRDTDGIN